MFLNIQKPCTALKPLSLDSYVAVYIMCCKHKVFSPNEAIGVNGERAVYLRAPQGLHENCLCQGFAKKSELRMCICVSCFNLRNRMGRSYSSLAQKHGTNPYSSPQNPTGIFGRQNFQTSIVALCLVFRRSFSNGSTQSSIKGHGAPQVNSSL